MGMGCLGLTHCEKCFEPLKDNECGLCKKCREEINQKDKKQYKGYELLKAIANGEIKEGSLILFDSIIWIVDEYSDIVKYKKEYITLFNTYKAKEIAMSDFELIENKIDIDSIGELKSVTNNIDGTVCIMNKINELVQAVKQINKEVKELENRK